ncbi:MAG: leucyl/phenylalanyl-tRNA--protein transferase [Gammaproteobacteria bacterium]|nr:leucyl/phenylalanyl-tRNA--protein transferase [Gammaproteobacteria bacterium]
MFVLNPDPNDLRFPPVELASGEGLLAIGGDLRVERVLAAYRQGIFPWYNDGQPILWWSPDPRAVLFPERLKVARSLRKTVRAQKFEIKLDHSFRDVMLACAGPRRQYPDGGTWITPAILEAYVELHRLGYAHSVEAWQDGHLVGGLYGLALGGIFFGESMFSHVSDASKVALVHLTEQLRQWGFRLIDCQMDSPHLQRLGAESIPRERYIALLAAALPLPGRAGRWFFDSTESIV